MNDMKSRAEGLGLRAEKPLLVIPAKAGIHFDLFLNRYAIRQDFLL
jgi:hypothetical protein